MALGLGLGMGVGRGFSPLQEDCSFDMNGTNAYLNFGNILNSTVAGTGHKFSVQRIVKREGLGTEQSIMGKWTGLGDKRMFDIRFNTSNQINVGFSNNGTAAQAQFNATVNSFTSTVDFYMITITWDFSVGNWSGIKCYVNGTAEAFASPSLAFPGAATIPSLAADLLFGSSTTGGGAKSIFFNGLDNGGVVYSDILTPTEISTRWNSGNILPPHAGNLVFSTDYNNSTWNGSEFDIIDTVSANNGVSVNVLQNEKLCVTV